MTGSTGGTGVTGVTGPTGATGATGQSGVCANNITPIISSVTGVLACPFVGVSFNVTITVGNPDSHDGQTLSYAVAGLGVTIVQTASPATFMITPLVSGSNTLLVIVSDGCQFVTTQYSFVTPADDACDNTTFPVVVWKGNDGNVYVKRWDGMAWVGLVGGDGPSVPGVWASNASVAMDAAGNPVVAWTGNDGKVYVKRWDGAAWVGLGGGVLAPSSGRPLLQLSWMSSAVPRSWP